MVAEILRDFWLSPVYGRNQAFLWASTRAPVWTTFIEIFVFFVVIWAVSRICLSKPRELRLIMVPQVVMFGLRKLVVEHTWLVPMVAIGLVSPRWAQSFWGISGLGSYIPWAGSAGHYVSTGLWLWLGMLDAVQGVGLGLMLLQTLSRVHVLSTLFVSQVWTSPRLPSSSAQANATGHWRCNGHRCTRSCHSLHSAIKPLSEFWVVVARFCKLGICEWPSASLAAAEALNLLPFLQYIALVSQVVIVVGFMVTFRKEVSHNETGALSRSTAANVNHRRTATFKAVACSRLYKSLSSFLRH